MLCLLACFACYACGGIVISLKDPASKQPLPDFSGLRMRDYAKHLGASLLAPPLPFEINLGPPRFSWELYRGLPHMLCLLCYAWEALGLAPLGGGLEKGRFAYRFGERSQDEGGLSR